MALTTCLECNRPVSTAAATCPNCGAPVASVAVTGNIPARPYTPFWVPSRISGVILTVLGILCLLFAFIRMNSLESQFRRSFLGGDEIMVGLFFIAAYLLLLGIPLFAGMARYLSRAGLIVFLILVLLLGPLALLVAWLPFVIPALKAKPLSASSPSGAS